MDGVLAALRAAAEPTRLRLLAMCAEGELTVSEMMQILGQSQPRVSRHLRLLTEAGLLERFREGSWVFHRLARDADMAARLVDLLPPDDGQLALDRQRLAEVKARRAEAAADYFRRNAPQWRQVRSLYVAEREVERVILSLLPEAGVEALLDIGTGTGRMLEVFGPRAARAEGVDLSRDMLAVARANLEKAGLNHCSVRQADLYQLPFERDTFDVAIVHQVLHFLDHPGRAVQEAARILRPGGRVVIADFAPHDREDLRDQHAHRRLGFADGEVDAWLRAAGLDTRYIEHLPGEPLTVTVWMAARPAPAAPDTSESRSQTAEAPA
ncbi:MAG: metalloregulator ArsR/SmtB family transcription factor [Hyphomicrobiales bacterium]|nr:metalloregulator ArsR/SmtB family transcription factor [Hyphomicrobiales bacterium]MCP5373352.1 metalloregulator ArsR/SmtB family transcription factor [Hyphomicrobiales bacterium]